MNQTMEYTPEQLAREERMVRYIGGIQNPARQDFIIAIGTAFMNGMEHGAAKEFSGGHGLKTSLVAGFEKRFHKFRTMLYL